jgi:predicted CoA-binding protein
MKKTMPSACFYYYLMVILGICGCSTTEKTPSSGCPSNMVWYQPGVSAERARRDLAECQNQALINGQSYSPIPARTAGQAILLGMLASSSENKREYQIVSTCMMAKGYQLVNRDQLLNASTAGNVNPVEGQPVFQDFKELTK